MGSKYSVLCANYPFQGYWEGSYDFDRYDDSVGMLPTILSQWNIVDVNIRLC